MGFIREFREFVMKGNIMELAVALIIGAAFGRIISSLVDNILMPVIGSFIGKSFDTMTTIVNGVVVKYGLFIQSLVDFLIIALVVFLIIKTLNRMKRKQAVQVDDVPVVSSTDRLLTEIRDALSRRP